MSDIIKQLQESKNKLLIAEANDVAMLKKLKHNKNDLEIFLNHCITELKFKTKKGKYDTIVCTSNTPLISVISAKKKKDKERLSVLKSKGITTHNSLCVNTWDIIENKMKTISLMSWQIMNFLLITKENILLLDQLLHDILKK